MKLICLNIWGGKLFEPLVHFIEREAVDTDIFCFQEVFNANTKSGAAAILPSGARADIYTRIGEILPDFAGHYVVNSVRPDFNGSPDFLVPYGLAMFVRRTHAIRKEGSVCVVDKSASGVSARWPYAVPRYLQYVTLEMPGGPITIANLHALLDDGEKRDTALRLAQFQAVRAALDGFAGQKVFCGDLNAYPDTESIRMFEEAGMRDLVKDFKVPTTRNDNYVGVKEFGDYVSDYIFVSPELVVTRFGALSDEVSDHLALVLKWE